MTAKSASSSPSSSNLSSDYLINLVWFGAVLYGIKHFLHQAYIIRMQAIEEFGPVIHEFDPYFNWRATQVCIFICIFFTLVWFTATSPYPNPYSLSHTHTCTNYIIYTHHSSSSIYMTMVLRNSSLGLIIWYGIL